MWYRKLQTSVRSLGKDESGANAVEFALVVPVLLLLILGIIQLGIILFTYNNMVQAAREAARVLAVRTASLTEATAVVNAQLGFSGLTFTVTPCAPPPATTNCGAPLDPAKDVSVTVSVPLAEASLINYQGFFSTGDLEATVTMRKEE